MDSSAIWISRSTFKMFDSGSSSCATTNRERNHQPQAQSDLLHEEAGTANVALLLLWGLLAFVWVGGEDKTRYDDDVRCKDVTCTRLLSLIDEKKRDATPPPNLCKTPLIDYYSTFKSCKWPISCLSAPFI